MQKVNQSESSQDIEMRETQTVSPDSIVREQASSESLPARSRWWCYWKRCTFLAMLVLCSLMLGYEINAQRPADVINIKTNTMSNYDQFSFLVFCPYSYYNKTRSFQRQQNGELRRMLQEQDIYNYELKVSDPSYDANSTYVVEARSLLFYFNTTDKNTGVRTLGNRTELFYCGVVRNYSDVCENSFMACSTPGPIFDIPDRKSVDIIWVNRLDRNILPEVSGTCFDNFQQIDEKGQPYPCKNMAKDDQKQATYLDPTQMGQFHSNIYLSPKNWPMTTHVHGAEIRPTFDGNPLSWIDNNHYDDGRVGVATFSLDEQCYYSSFDKIVNGSNFHPPNIQLIGQVVNKSNYKINRYPNRQNPGNLWYHDHAMHLTDYNVGNGLQGLYILRDAQVERKIGVSRENEKLVLIVGLGYNKTTASFNINSGFIAGEVYRFRFLNNNFDDGDRSMIAVSFSYNECNDAIKQRQKFTIIGADSSLFNTGIYNQTHFVIAQAQRMEILIKFNQTKSFAICADEWKTSIHDLFASHRNRGLTETVRRVVNRNHQIEENQMPQSHVQHEFSDLPNRKTSLSGIKILARPHEYKSLNTRKDINDVNLGVPFPDLRNVNDSQIAVKRMRPLLWIGHKIFTINGRLEFHSGWSENPTIGTIEDWIIPNTIWFPHPIHVHLINFQVIREYDLQLLMPDKSNPSTYCSIYELDFLRMSVDLAMNLTGAASDKILLRAKKQIYPEGPDGRVDYSFLCKNRTFIGYQATVRKALAIIFPEYSIDSNRVSGLNLLSKFASNNNTIFKSLLALNSNLSYPLDKNNGQNQFIYVRDEGHPSRKPYYGRLKDTAFVEPFKALHYRIRWAKSDFTEKDAKEGTYFNVPNDQLREFPGYVYHCHILRHEDNEMMRPIMLQLPQNAKLDKETHCNYNDTHTSSPIPNFLWEDKYNCINNRCKTLKKKLAP